jgi:hypothetical protein
MAGAIINSVSGDTEGRVAGIGYAQCQAFGGVLVPRGGVEQAAVGNQ